LKTPVEGPRLRRRAKNRHASTHEREQLGRRSHRTPLDRSVQSFPTLKQSRSLTICWPRETV